MTHIMFNTGQDKHKHDKHHNFTCQHVMAESEIRLNTPVNHENNIGKAKAEYICIVVDRLIPRTKKTKWCSFSGFFISNQIHAKTAQVVQILQEIVDFYNTILFYTKRAFMKNNSNRMIFAEQHIKILYVANAQINSHQTTLDNANNSTCEV